MKPDKQREVDGIRPDENPGEFEGMVIKMDLYGLVAYYDYEWTGTHWAKRQPVPLDLPEGGIKKGDFIEGCRIVSITLIRL